MRLVGLGLLLAVAGCTPIKDPAHGPRQSASTGNAQCSAAAGSCSDVPQESTAGASDNSDPAKVDNDAGSGRTAATTVTPPPTAGGKPDASAADSGKPEDAGRATTDAAPPDAGVVAADDDALVLPDDSECEYIEVRARNDASGAPIPVASGDFLQCFLLDAGFDAPTQAFRFSPLLDNAGVVSDIILRVVERSENRGPVVPCDDAYPTHQMVASWAPGSDDWYYPKDMGIDLGRGLFLLEVHYANNGSPTTDRSGMRICTSKKLRPRAASMSWLGNRNFSVPGGAKNYAVKGRCVPANQTEPIHILRVFPFMNGLGRRAAMQVDGIDGATQLLFDEPYDSSSRKIYNTPAVVRVGDSVLSTCIFDNPKSSTVRLGIKNDDELCHMLVLAYPPHALVDSAWSIENNSCAGAQP